MRCSKTKFYNMWIPGRRFALSGSAGVLVQRIFQKILYVIPAKAGIQIGLALFVFLVTPIYAHKKRHAEIKLPRPVIHVRNVVIVIDPGHGGKDPGASGPRGVHEKTVVLQISQKLQKLINEQPGFKAVLTRKGDYYLSLRRRLRLARRYKPDMFVAIHADAYYKRSSHGASVFALSERGATSEAARWLARRENASELVGGTRLSERGYLLRKVLINLSQNYTIAVSLKIGNALLHQMQKFAYLHTHHVEQAAFVVLKSPDIPSLLVETGFLSNYQEEKRLSSDGYQKRLAYGLMRGIVSYFKSRPPRGTYYAFHQK